MPTTVYRLQKTYYHQENISNLLRRFITCLTNRLKTIFSIIIFTQKTLPCTLPNCTWYTVYYVLVKITSARFTQIFCSCPTHDPNLSSRKNVVPGKYFQARVGRMDRDSSPAVHPSPASCSSWPSSQNSVSRLIITPHLFPKQVIGSVSADGKGSCPTTILKQLAIKFFGTVRTQR